MARTDEVRRGQRYGARVVIRETTPDEHGRKRVVVRCECGGEMIVLASALPITRQCASCYRWRNSR